jgi:hypothetical protein
MRDQKVKTSWYHKFIGGWKRAFGSDLLILDSEVLKKTPWISVEQVEQHLGLPSQVSEDSFVVGPRVINILLSKLNVLNEGILLHKS